MNLEYYELQGRALYFDFAGVVGSILKCAFAECGRPLRPYIQHRAKSVASLLTKLQDRDLLASGEIEKKIFDLAGCRAIFLDDSDFDYVRKNGLISELFAVDWDHSKLHHHEIESANVNDLYRGAHYVVSLKEDRASLAEYRRFAGLRCEIQLQTILTHAWSEAAHDIIYKPPDTERFGGSLMDGIKERMRLIMKEHIVPAGHALSIVRRDFDRLKRGLEIVERGGPKDLGGCQNNNERFELLQNYRSYVLRWLEPAGDEHSEIIQALLAAADAARKSTAPDIQTPMGAYRGRDANEIIREITAIVRHLHYLDVKMSLDAYCRLHELAEGDAARNQILEAVGTLAGHNISVWNRAGPAVQADLMAAISQWDAPKRHQHREIALAVARAILGVEMHRFTETSESVKLERGPVIPCDALMAVRNKAIDCVIAYYSDARSDDERRNLIDILLHGTFEPDRPNESLRTMLRRDATTIVDFLKDAAKAANFCFRAHIEHRVHYLHRRLNLRGDEDGASLGKSIKAFRSTMDANEDFQIYKLLVGFESVFPPAWDDPNFHWNESENYRKQAFANLIKTVAPETHDAWRARLNECASTQSSDLATFWAFVEFLKLLGRERPEFSAQLLSEPQNKVAEFAAPLLEGIEASGRDDLVKRLEDGWLASGRTLWAIIERVPRRQTFDLELLARATKRSIVVGDKGALQRAMGVAAQRINDGARPLIDKVFLPAFHYFCTKGEWRWINDVCLRLPGAQFFGHFSCEEVAEILDNLVAAPQVDYLMKMLLAQMAATYPAEVVRYFGKRIARRPSQSNGPDYEPVPHELGNVSTALSAQVSDVVDWAFEWLGLDGERALYWASRFINRCYGDLSPPLAEKLKDFVEHGPDEKRKFALSILDSYSGADCVVPAVRALVPLIESIPDLQEALLHILTPRGFTWGQYGRREALSARIADIQPWLNDEKPVVADFANRTCQFLKNEMATEIRRAEQSAALWRAEFNEDLVTRD